MTNNTGHRESLEHYLALQYPVRLIAEREGGYTALVPDLEGCMTQGETLEEAAAMAEDARHGWIEVEYERGNEIPLPSYTEEHSGKFNVRIPRSLHRSLAMAAEDEGISLNQYVVALLARGDAQARIERRLGDVESELHAGHSPCPDRDKNGPGEQKRSRSRTRPAEVLKPGEHPEPAANATVHTRRPRVKKFD